MSQNKYQRCNDGTYLVLTGNGDGDCTQAQMRDFKRWTLTQGFIFRRTYRVESIKSAWTAAGVGRFEGVSIHGINRVTLPEDHMYTNRKGELVMVTPERGHKRGDESVMIDCHISCFWNKQNLNGWHGLYWQDLLLLPPHRDMAWLLRMHPRRGSEPLQNKFSLQYARESARERAA